MNKYSYLITWRENGEFKEEIFFLKKIAVARYIELCFIPSWDERSGSISDLKIFRDFYYKRDGRLVRENYTQAMNRFLA